MKKALKFLLTVLGIESLLLPTPKPEITKEQAIERARAYAETNNKRWDTPWNIHLAWRLTGTKKDQRYVTVYEMTLGGWRPMPIVEVNAVTGEIHAWRTLSR